MLKNMKSKNIKNVICLYEHCFKTALEIKALLFPFVTFHKKIYTQYILNDRVGGLWLLSYMTKLATFLIYVNNEYTLHLQMFVMYIRKFSLTKSHGEEDI